MNRLLFIIILIFSFSLPYHAIELSEKTKISLLTCGEGDELHSFFGHSAIRIKDPENNFDICYNWGLFEGDPEDAEFKIDFAKGLVKYKISEEPFDYFMYQYFYEERSVHEQVLNLTLQQITDILEKINENLKPENRYYKYDFFFDNCATRVRDIIISGSQGNLSLKKHKDANELSFRQIIAHNLASTPWINFGTDIILGKKIDAIANNNELMFLPRYIKDIFTESTVLINGKEEPFVLETNLLFEGRDRSDANTSFWTPTLLMWIVFLITAALTFFQITFVTKFWDTLLLLLLCSLGLVICFLWFATEHESAKINFNLLWANPLHIIFIISMLIPKLHAQFTWLYLGMSVVYFFMIIGAMLIPQEFNSAFIPIIILLAMKYFYWYKQTKKPETKVEL